LAEVRERIGVDWFEVPFHLFLFLFLFLFQLSLSLFSLTSSFMFEAPALSPLTKV